MTLVIFRQCIRFVIETICVVFLFQRIPSSKNRKKRWLGLLCLLITTPIYMTAFFDFSLHSVTRFLIRFAAIWGYLILYKGLKASLASYFTLLFNIATHGTQVIMLTAPLAPLHLSAAGRTPTVTMTFYALLLEYAILLLQLWLIRRFVKPHEISSVGPVRGLLVTIILLIEVYIKGVLAVRWIAQAPYSTADNLYPLFIVLLIDVFIIVLEKHFKTKTLHENEQLNNILQQHQIQMLQNQIDHNSRVIQLHHDMKSHLISIASIADHPQQVTAYVNSLLGNIKPDFVSVHTGNSIINNLLSYKLYQANELDIKTHIALDVTSLSRISPADLCVIFGNALDNAIEAAQKEPDSSKRFLSLKSQHFANQLLICISNNCPVPVRFKNGRPLTTKQSDDFTPHGIGYGNIQNAVSKYGGTVSSSYRETEQRFDLTIMLEIQNE